MREIVHNPDGTLIVPVTPERQHAGDADEASGDGAQEEPTAPTATTQVLHPGEGGYDEALAEWDHQQNPDREPVVSTPSGREAAIEVVHTVATSPDVPASAAIEALDDPEPCGEALRHVLMGGVPSVEDFAKEVAEAKGGEPLSAHEATKIIGEVLAELD